ncbi:MAG: Y-family DNA polymerase [Flavobacteriaceae bacterium]|nr:Y-family DNA polymerase [Flavobacteriaceae bacterium]|tara:strand:- start:2252 stop:3511 length:1260 start_codon:yes stop_codon:yes gene_type:complete
MFALVDCNNFYASCERVFQPQWKGKPVVILSNNDGCVIARSNEAKALGIPMGAPAFKYQAQFKRQKIKVFSSNYPLYGDMSSRVMSILERYTPNIELYSIDEAFLQFKGFDLFDLQKEGMKMQKQIKKWTGIPVSVGIAPSKALAKIANKIAKKFAVKTGGVYSINTEEKRIKALKWTSISDVWGIGRQHLQQLEAIGVANAWQFSLLSDDWVRKQMSVLGLRLKKDLQGLPSIQLEEVKAPKKGIATTRSFEGNLTSFSDLEERVSTFASNCAEKMRKQQSSCQALLVFIRSDPHKKDVISYRNSCVLTLPYATNSSIILSRYAILGLRKIFKENIAYKKAGVMIMGLLPTEKRQLNLFENNNTKHVALMKSLDKIHKRFGPYQIKLANQDLNRTWKMKQQYLSNRFTTELKDVITVK